MTTLAKDITSALFRKWKETDFFRCGQMHLGLNKRGRRLEKVAAFRERRKFIPNGTQVKIVGPHLFSGKYGSIVKHKRIDRQRVYIVAVNGGKLHATVRRDLIRL